MTSKQHGGCVRTLQIKGNKTKYRDIVTRKISHMITNGVLNVFQNCYGMLHKPYHSQVKWGQLSLFVASRLTSKDQEYGTFYFYTNKCQPLSGGKLSLADTNPYFLFYFLKGSTFGYMLSSKAVKVACMRIYVMLRVATFRWIRGSTWRMDLFFYFLVTFFKKIFYFYFKFLHTFIILEKKFVHIYIMELFISLTIFYRDTPHE